MTDTYSQLVNNGMGKTVATRLGLPRPATLRRYEQGQSLLEAPAAVGTVADGTSGQAARGIVVASGAEAVDATPETTYAGKLGAVVLDATAAATIDDLEQLRAILAPAVKALGKNGRVVILGTTPAEIDDVERAAVQQGLEGIMRSIGKELRAGGTANLLWLDGDAQGDAALLAAPLRFLLSSRSAYVSGQPLRVRSAQVSEADDWTRPYVGQTVVVTGAARGIGAAIAKVYARAGAHVIAVDIPAAGEALATVANEIGGTALQLDITAADAGRRIADAVAQRAEALDVIVHNAGITRDKLFVNTDADRWGSVLDVNLRAEMRIDDVLLDPSVKGGLRDGGRIVSVASTSGIGGNRGQANYAASKAGVMGMVRRLGEQLRDRQITVNAVAPGFIETEMTSKIPFATREVGRRINSLMQGGQPVDVGETIAFLSEPGSAGVTGQVLRVCGQSQLGA
ncbi:3-oxoacyl-[acyl-carrier protein] reductase [Barrientosiimonas humi]|uniref:3-oxoacyl-[acyl-carrier protein] reductase n=1 Tax=Barrientosiimonas humi TaxID=999931 RepID=A0A542X8M5_9MICO|nr:3-oxoacyl-ACP reductase [Barrientosiimonas humi]TQL32182.1 3-oxoacyl-[acyl-carrier protein] reductase [Barrientosiimonas humi]CAG7572170.1 3-oxoacyl-[acyl-carrier-protein] reductase FabG [Barrientosiimonas humi]